MIPLFYVVIALSIGAIAVTVHALFSAPEGYEDEEGFHAIRARAARKPEAGTTPAPGAGVHPRLFPRYSAFYSRHVEVRPFFPFIRSSCFAELRSAAALGRPGE